MENAKLVVKKGVSKSGNNYCSLVLDLGYRQIFLSSMRDNSSVLCAELLGISVQDLLLKPDGNYIVMESV